MKHLAATSLLFLAAGCSFRAAYPAIGGGLGAGAGSLGGPGGAIGGSMLGSSLGTAIMERGNHDAIEAKVDALTSGDVAKLIELRAEEERSGFDKVISGIYQVLTLAAIGVGLWISLPFLYRFLSKRIHRKVEAKINGASNE